MCYLNTEQILQKSTVMVGDIVFLYSLYGLF